MKKTRLTPWDGSEFITGPEAQADLLADALESGHAPYVAHALGLIAKARGMTQIAREAGVSRESLYKSLSLDGNPELATVLAVAKALKLELTARAVGQGREARSRKPAVTGKPARLSFVNEWAVTVDPNP